MRTVSYTLILLSVVTLMLSCNDNSKRNLDNKKEFKYQTDSLIASTEHFELRKEKHYYLLSVSSPFVGSNDVETYVLYPEAIAPPEVPNVEHYIQIPVKRTAITSTTHLGYLNAIKKQRSIVGANNLELAYDSTFIRRMSNGQVKTLGKQQVDHEALVEIEADLLFGFAIDMASYKNMVELRSLGQKVVFIAEFMEGEPIEKAKWLKVFSVFYGENSLLQADSIMYDIEHKYQKLLRMVDSVKNEPSVMIGLPWKGTWYVSGGESFQARFLKDAGANYIWSNRKQKGSVPLAVETVFNQAMESDYWINPGIVRSKSQLLDQDQRFGSFSAFTNDKIFNQTRRLSPHGGNDYWESGVVKPHLILADLIHIFHNGLLENHKLYFYEKLKEP